MDRKVTLTAGALANLTSQSQTITADGMTNILNASAAIIKPYSVRCRSHNHLPKGRCRRQHQSQMEHAERHGPHSRCSVTLPSADLAVPNTYLVWSEVNYNYTPVVGYTITGTLPLADQMFIEPAHHAAGLRQQRPAPKLYIVTKIRSGSGIGRSVGAPHFIPVTLLRKHLSQIGDVCRRFAFRQVRACNLLCFIKTAK